MSAEKARKPAKAREEVAKAEKAAMKEEAERVARVGREPEVNRNLEVAVLSLRGAESKAGKKAGCEGVAKAHEKVKRLEVGAPSSLEVVVAGAWQAAGGVVTKKVAVVVQLNGAIIRERTAELKGVVDQVQALVKERKQMLWNVAAVVWIEYTSQ